MREARAFDNVLKAIDLHETCEKISINNHKSFLIHIAIYKARCTPKATIKSAVCVRHSYPPCVSATRIRQTVQARARTHARTAPHAPHARTARTHARGACAQDGQLGNCARARA